jgi:hypothetical protein
MESLITTLKNLGKEPLVYVLEDLQFKHRENTLWVKFGIENDARTINYISQFTTNTVYGFDSFEGLPEKWIDGYDAGTFSTGGVLPPVNSNVTLVKGWFQDTLPDFLATHNKKISLIHLDCNLYSSTKYVLDTLIPYIDDECVIVLGNLVNFPEFTGETGQLRALFEFATQRRMHLEWIGMNGTPYEGYSMNQNVGVLFHCYFE